MRRKGFTLIELLVVIAIIGLLSSLAVVSLNNARDKAKDAQIKSDLSQFRTYMALTYDDGDFSGVTAGTDQSTNEMSAVTPSLTHPDQNLNYVVNVDATASPNEWAAYGALMAASGSYFCVDSTGRAVTVSSDPGTATACP